MQSDDLQEMETLARDILLELAYAHYIPPPTRLLQSLHAFEESNRDTIRAGDYVPRDHFVHLVNLYLLGVYIFAYHPAINSACSADLTRIKRQHFRAKHLQFSGTTGRETAYHLFSTAWTQFVLYHDLAYPLERIWPNQRAVSKKWYRPFHGLRDYLIKDLSLAGLSKLIVLNYLATGNGGKLGSMFLNHEESFFIKSNPDQPRSRYFCVQRSEDGFVADSPDPDTAERLSLTVANTISAWADAVYLYRVSDDSAIRYLGSVVPDSSLCAILESSAGAPWVLLIKNQPNDCLWFQHPKEASPGLPRRSSLLWKSAFVRASPPVADSVWRYFSIEPLETVEELAAEIFGDGKSDFDILLNMILRSDDFREADVSDGSAHASSYAAYKVLSQIRGYLREPVDDLKIARIFEGIDKGFKTVSLQLHQIAGAILQERVHQLLSTDTSLQPLEKLRTEGLDVAASAFARFIWKGLSDKETDSFLQERLRDRIGEVSQESLELEQAVRACHSRVRSALANVIVPGSPCDDPFEECNFDKNFSLTCLPDACTKKLDAQFQQRDLPTMGDLCQTYRPSWVKSEEKFKNVGFVDHGLAGATIALACSSIYKKIETTLSEHAGPDVQYPVSLLRLAMGTTSSIDEEWLGLEREFLEKITSVSIALHNLYPADLGPEHRSYRTRLGDDPLTFLALFADGLQRWDRKALASLAKSDKISFLPGSRFDLRVEGNRIQILVRRRRMAFGSEETNLRESLQSYLQDADQYIRLELVEQEAPLSGRLR